MTLKPVSKFRIFFGDIRRAGQVWRRKNPHGTLRFTLGILRHPSQARGRIRELMRVAFAPALSEGIRSDALPQIELVAVESDEQLQGRLVALYRRNPSPYVNGPQSVSQLHEYMNRGIMFYLIRNSDGEYVGARAFDPGNKMLQNSISDFRHRGNGYQIASGIELRKLLATEGYTEFRSNVLRANTRVQRSMRAAGWEIEPHPDHPDLMRGVIRPKE